MKVDVMTLTFKDSDGNEWRICKWRAEPGGELRLDATADDLTRADFVHVPDTHEVIPKGRHEWVLKSDLDAAKAEVDRLTAKLDATKAGISDDDIGFIQAIGVQRKRAEAAESELAATKAKLADAVARLNARNLEYDDLWQSRDVTKARLAEVERERDDAVKAVDTAHGVNIAQREALANVRSELERARRVITTLANDWERAGRHVAAKELRDALASAAPAADRTEAPRAEAGEHDWYRGFDGAYHSHDWHCAHCGEGRNGSEPDARGCKGRPKPPEEPKPEPQPSGEEAQRQKEREHLAQVRAILDDESYTEGRKAQLVWRLSRSTSPED